MKFYFMIPMRGLVTGRLIDAEKRGLAIVRALALVLVPITWNPTFQNCALNLKIPFQVDLLPIRY